MVVNKERQKEARSPSKGLLKIGVLFDDWLERLQTFRTANIFSLTKVPCTHQGRRKPTTEQTKPQRSHILQVQALRHTTHHDIRGAEVPP